MTLGEIFLANFPPNENGWTEIITLEQLEAINPKFNTKNGCSWGRSDAAWLRPYNFKRFHANELGGKGNKTIAFQLQGFKDISKNRSIPAEVRKELKGKPCVVLGVIAGEMEIDHKNGRYDNNDYGSNDFQSMTKAVNDAKRQHCKRCLENKKRFDAKSLGYTVSFIEGDADTLSCPGCYWYDPIAFRHALVKGEK